MSTTYQTQSTPPRVRRAKAWVLEPHHQSMKNASDFGDVTYIYDERDERPGIWSPEFVPVAVQDLIAKDFDPEHDYFVVVGNMVPLAMLLCGLVARFGRINALLFSATERSYVHRRLGG